jgi:hypothetical protein
MKKTALQQVIIEIAELWSSPSDQPNYVQVFDVLKSKLPVEEQQIIDFADDYVDNCVIPNENMAIPTKMDVPTYFNETFKQQEQ